jgi:predicted anti-sigma-YlaC factor YlaD
MLTCRQMTDLVTEYLEARMPLMDRARFQMHLGMCSRCRRYLRQMKLSVRTLGMLRPESVPPQLIDELLARFRDWKD